jgi:hypothetical protein
LTVLKKFVPPLLSLLIIAAPGLAEPSGGTKEADGSIVYTLSDGTVLVRPDGVVGLTVPSAKDWAAIALSGFHLSDAKAKREGVMFMTEADARGFIVSAYFEKVSKAKSAAGCCDHYFEHALKSPAPKTNVERYEQGDMAIGSYTVAETQGVRIDQQNWNAYLHARGYCLDVHISKTLYDRARDESAVKKLLSSIGIVPKR